jgi:hypothetical protein
MAWSEMSAIERLRKQLEVPASLMGGETFILNIADVRAALAAIDRLRSALRVQFLRTSPETSHAEIDKFLDGICE